jgi:hypothetical protein
MKLIFNVDQSTLLPCHSIKNILTNTLEYRGSRKITKRYLHIIRNFRNLTTIFQEQISNKEKILIEFVNLHCKGGGDSVCSSKLSALGFLTHLIFSWTSELTGNNEVETLIFAIST